MSKRLKVLLSAYACEPNKGSEPEVGWQWAMQMARYHDVTVLTRRNNRAGIEKELEQLRGKQPLPNFVYHDEGRLLLWMKNRFGWIRAYYILWQISAWKVVSKLNQEIHFDLMHHVTFAGFRYRTAIWDHNVPTVWGPIGGIRYMPWPLLPWSHPPSLLLELFRHTNNFLQSAPFHLLPQRGQNTTISLVSTEDMEEIFKRLGLEATLMPTIGLHARKMPEPVLTAPEGKLKVLFVGSVITLKGIDLAIEAFAAANANATFTIIGDGRFMRMARRTVRELGIESKVEFRGRVPLQKALECYKGFDVFLFPSLHDTGGFALIEAMASGLPAICLDCGGPRLAVREGAGIKVPLGTRESVIKGLTEAIRRYDSDRKLVVAHGRAARQIIVDEYDWETKGREMDSIYHEALLKWSGDSPGKQKDSKFSRIFTRFFPIKGLAISGLILLLIAAAGFLSVDRLKNDARGIVEDTLPALSDAGAANASLAESFNRTLLMMITEKPEEQAAYRKELDSFMRQTSESLELYSRAKSTGEERALYNEVIQDRQKYHAIRQQVMDLFDQHQESRAFQICNSSMLPAYRDYKVAAEKLLKYDAQQGTLRGQSILRICLITQWVVAVVGAGLFVVGFLIGLLK